MKRIQFLKSAFSLYPDEIKKTLHFGWLGFLWSAAGACAVTLFDGLFLETVGPKHLPGAYGYIAIGLITSSFFLFKGLKVLSLKGLLRSVIWTNFSLYALALVLIYTMPGFNSAWFYGYKVISTIGYASLSITFWSFVDEYYDLQDAKRIYTLIMAAEFAGAIFSGALISLSIDWIQSGGVVFATLTLLALCQVILQIITKKYSPVHDDLEEVISLAKKSLGFKSLAKRILKSPYVLSLIGVNIGAQLLWNVTEFNYMTSFTEHFHGESSYELIEFLGSTKAWISLGNMLFMLFAYSRMIRRVGLNNSALVPYLLFFGLYAFWISAPSFALAIFGIIAVEGVLFTIEDNNFNLFLNITTDKIKRPLRIFIEAFVEPATILAASGLLSIDISSIYMGLFVSLFAVAVAWALRRSYRPAILKNLQERAIRFDRPTTSYLSQLGKKERKRQASLLALRYPPSLSAAKLLLAIGSERDFAAFLDRCDTLSPKELEQIISQFNTYNWTDRGLFISACEHFLKQYNSIDIKGADGLDLISALLLILSEAGKVDESMALTLLEHADFRLQAAGILSLEHAGAAKKLKEAYEKRTLAIYSLQQLLSSHCPDALAMGLYVQSRMDYESDIKLLFPFLDHPQPAVQLAAADSLSQLLTDEHSEFIPQLFEALERLRLPKVRLKLLQAVKKLVQKEHIIPLARLSARLTPIEKRACVDALAQAQSSFERYIDALKDLRLDLEARLVLAKAAFKRSPRRFRKALYAIALPEIERCSAYYVLQNSSENPHLAAAIRATFHHTRDYLIHLLAVGGSLEDSDLIIHGLRSSSEKVHSHCVETVEKTCERKLFRLIEPLIDDRPSSEKMRKIRAKLPKELSTDTKGMIEYMYKSSFQSDRLIALYEIALSRPEQLDKYINNLPESDRNSKLTEHLIQELPTAKAQL